MKKQTEKDKLTALHERLSHDDEKSKGRKAISPYYLQHHAKQK